MKLFCYVTIFISSKHICLIFVPKLSALPINYHYQKESERKWLKLSPEMQI